MLSLTRLPPSGPRPSHHAYSASSSSRSAAAIDLRVLPRYYRRPRLHFRSQHQTFLFLRLPKTRRAATPASSDPMSRSTAAAALDPRPRFPDASIPRRCLLLAIIRRHTANATYQLQPFSCLGRTAPTRPDQTEVAYSSALFKSFRNVSQTNQALCWCIGLYGSARDSWGGRGARIRQT